MDHKNGWISSRMSPVEIFSVMTDGCPGAARVLFRIGTSKFMSLSDIIALDSMGIHGKKLHRFWKKCCKKNLHVMKELIDDFRAGKLTYDDVQVILDSKR